MSEKDIKFTKTMINIMKNSKHNLSTLIDRFEDIKQQFEQEPHEEWRDKKQKEKFSAKMNDVEKEFEKEGYYSIDKDKFLERLKAVIADRGTTRAYDLFNTIEQYQQGL